MDKTAWVQIPTEILEDVLYKTSEVCVKHSNEIDKLNKHVADLVDQIAKLTAENRELKNTNTDLHVKLQGLLSDDEF